MMKIVKICLFSLLLVGTFGVVFCATFVGVNLLKFQSIPLQAEALTSQNLPIAVFDSKNKPIEEENEFSSFCSLDELPSYTPEAFLSIEDKQFFEHHGLNYKRMVGAMMKNIKTASLREGASTISQQLIKNTHLSSEKTFERKLKEIALTKKLEKSFSKEEILESYLNIIFFGNNCYGLESAAQYYFNKPSSKLSLAESATLAGLIKSPTKYSPIHNPQNCIGRRNLVLSEMEKDGYITAEEKMEAQNQPIKLDIQSQNSNKKLNTYSQSAIDEAAKILGISPKQIAVGGYHIHTYQNAEKQASLSSAFEKIGSENVDTAGIVIDSAKSAVTAYVGNSNFKLMDCRRQPASCLKPLLVYAPALNEGLISPDTQILDEKITIGGYSPSNVNKKYGGYMSVTDAVKNSVNIPAIKVLSYIGIDTGKQYAEKLGITFDEQDDSYALALGGMTYGVNLKELASAYTTFANGGTYSEPKFVQYITDGNNKLVYVHKPGPRMVLREDSAYLMTNILQETAKSGTSRKLSDVKNTEIASKTGTVGKKNASGNTDAYNISYTPEEVIGVWFGRLDNQPMKIAGGNQPTEVVRTYLGTQKYEKTAFDVPSSVEEAKIDTLELEENHRLMLASPYAPERFTKTAIFSRFNMPTEISTNFTERPKIDATAKVEDGQIVLEVNAQKHLSYQIFKDGTPYQKIQDKSGVLTLRIPFSTDECDLQITATYTALTENNKSPTKNVSSHSQISTDDVDFMYRHPEHSRGISAGEGLEQSQSALTSTQTFHLKRTNAGTTHPKEKWYI